MIELVKFEIGQIENLVELYNKADRTYLTNALPYPYTKENAKGWIDYVSKIDGKDGVFRVIKYNGEIVGTITVTQKTDIYSVDSEIGYLTNPEYCNKGITTIAIEKICQLAFDVLEISRITARVFEENIASCRVLEKNGFTEDCIIENGCFKNGQYNNYKIYGKYSI